MLREQFEEVLADFGGYVRQKLVLGEDGTATFTVDDEIIINILYLEESDYVVIFSPIEGFGGMDAPDAGKSALALLRLCKLGGPSEGFTLALDEEADLVLAMDRRSALDLAYADSLASWLDALIRAVRAVRETFAEHFTEVK